jgi:hypothetical protein
METQAKAELVGVIRERYLGASQLVKNTRLVQRSMGKHLPNGKTLLQ